MSGSDNRSGSGESEHSVALGELLVELVDALDADRASLSLPEGALVADGSTHGWSCHGGAASASGTTLTIHWRRTPPTNASWLTRARGVLQRTARQQAPSLVSDLQRAVLARVASGARSDEVAEELGYSVYYVKDLMATLRQRLGATDRTHAAALGVAQGLIALDGDGTFYPVTTEQSRQLPPQEGSAMRRNAID